MPNMLVTYYTRSGHTQHMAETIAEAARTIPGVLVEVLPVDRVQAQDLLSYDAIILGSPTYYGTMAWPIKKLLDDSVQFHTKLAGKVGGAFASSANVGGGNETTILDMINALLIHGMVVPGNALGDHYGPVAINDVDDRSRRQCAAWGKLWATLTAKLVP